MYYQLLGLIGYRRRSSIFIFIPVLKARTVEGQRGRGWTGHSSLSGHQNGRAVLGGPAPSETEEGARHTCAPARAGRPRPCPLVVGQPCQCLSTARPRGVALLCHLGGGSSPCCGLRKPTASRLANCHRWAPAWLRPEAGARLLHDGGGACARWPRLFPAPSSGLLCPRVSELGEHGRG